MMCMHGEVKSLELEWHLQLIFLGEAQVVLQLLKALYFSICSLVIMEVGREDEA